MFYISKSHLYIIYFLLIGFIQTGNCGSLEQETDSVDFYISEAKNTLFRNLDSCWFFIEQAEAIAKGQSSFLYQGKVSGIKGIYYDVRGVYDTAFIHYERAIEIYTELEEDYLLANVLNNLGLSHFRIYDYERASIYYQRATSIYRELGETGKAARTLNNLGLVFYEIGDNEKALESFELAMERSLVVQDTSNYYSSMHAMASVLTRLGKNRRAINMLDSVMIFFRKKDQPYNLAKSLQNAGDNYIKLYEYDRAKASFEESLILKKQFKNDYDIYSTLESLADLYYTLEKYETALNYADSALRLAETLDMESVAAISRSKAYILHVMGDFEGASKNYYNYIVLSDTLDEIEITAKITELNRKYDVAKKDKEIAELALENELTENELKISQYQMVGIGAFSIIVITFLIVYLKQQRDKNRLRHSLLNEEIDGLRLKIGNIMSDIQLEEIEVDTEKLKNELPNTLTEREVQILRVAVTNKSNAEIADEVCLSVNTVKYHLKNIYGKLGVSTRLEAREALSQIN